MTTLLLIIMLLSGAILSLCVLLMSPKWWLGFGIGGVTSGNEYGTSKTLESKLKSIITISGIIFILSSIFYPYTKPIDQIKIDWLLNGGVTSWDVWTNPIDNLDLDNSITPSIDTPQVDMEGVDLDFNTVELTPELPIE